MVLERCAERKIQTQCQQAGNRPTSYHRSDSHMTRHHQSSICPGSVCMHVCFCVSTTHQPAVHNMKVTVTSVQITVVMIVPLLMRFFFFCSNHILIFICCSQLSMFFLFITQHTFWTKLAPFHFFFFINFVTCRQSTSCLCLCYFSPLTINC